MPGVLADRGKREPVLRGGQPVTVLLAASAGDRRVLHVHLEEGERADGARRAGPQRCQPGAALKDEGDHHDHVRGGAVRPVVAAAVPGVLAHQILAAVADRREVHHRVAADRPVAGRLQLVHKPAALRHIQPAVPGGLQSAVVRPHLPSARLQQLGAHVVLQQQSDGHGGAEENAAA